MIRKRSGPVTATRHGAERVCLAWSGEDGSRYHVWVHNDLSMTDQTLHLNDRLGHRGLRAMAAPNLRMVDEAIRYARDNDLVAAADKAAAEKEVADEARRRDRRVSVVRHALATSPKLRLHADKLTDEEADELWYAFAARNSP